MQQILNSPPFNIVLYPTNQLDQIVAKHSCQSLQKSWVELTLTVTPALFESAASLDNARHDVLNRQFPRDSSHCRATAASGESTTPYQAFHLKGRRQPSTKILDNKSGGDNGRSSNFWTLLLAHCANPSACEVSKVDNTWRNHKFKC